MIVATAGHVDHGKTALVRALTGVDTDRLPEEQRRGLSIDLGFAHVDTAAGRLGFVDLPGHGRFIANALAGLASVDAALLVVAADDGPMPQTREHLAILGALEVKRCVVALTKVDRVGADRQAAARRETAALLAAGWAGAEIFPVIAPTGEGVPGLRAALEALAAALPVRDPGGDFRMAVDRSFTRDGSGRVVTGVVLAGRVRVGDRVVVSPAGTGLRVRGVQAWGRSADSATAGERCALNLAGADLKDAVPVRGDWVVAPGLHAPSDRLDVRLRVAPSSPRALRSHEGGLRLHLGASAVGVRVAMLGGDALPPGGSGFAQLVLDRPVSALHGDRFVLRDPAAGGCLGGGTVVDPFAVARGRVRPGRPLWLAALEAETTADALANASALGGLDLDRFLLARNCDAAAAEALLRDAPVKIVAIRSGRVAVDRAQWWALRSGLVEALGEAHGAEPDSIGPTEASLAARLGALGAERAVGDLSLAHVPLRQRSLGQVSPGQVSPGHVLPDHVSPGHVSPSHGSPGNPALGYRQLSHFASGHAALAHAALGELAAEGVVVAEGFRWRLAGHRPVPSPDDAECLARLVPLLDAAGLRPPIVGELAATLELPLADLLARLARAGRAGTLVRVAPNRWFLPATVAALAGHARDLARQTPAGFDAAVFRDRTGIGRNLTVQVLEFLDREGVTRFDGERRVCRD